MVWMVLGLALVAVDGRAQVLSTADIGLTVHRGFLIPHRPEARHLQQGHTTGAAFHWSKRAKGAWYFVYAKPEIGLDAYFTTTGNRQQLGDQIAAHLYARLPLHKRRVHNVKTGFGVGYATKTWDLEDNTRALMLGSHLNAAILLEYEWRPLQTRWNPRFGVRLQHFSNGAFQLPNLGTNVVSVFIGVSNSWHPVASATERVMRDFAVDSLSQSIGHWTWMVNGAFGVREVGDPMGSKHGVFHLGFMGARRWSYKSSWSAGLDIYYNRSMRALLAENDVPPSVRRQLLAGVNVGYGLHMNQWVIRIIQGVYAVDPYGGYGRFYQRIGVRYWATPKCFLQFLLKTHFARADHAELGIGYAIGP